MFVDEAAIASQGPTWTMFPDGWWFYGLLLAGFRHPDVICYRNQVPTNYKAGVGMTESCRNTAKPQSC